MGIKILTQNTDTLLSQIFFLTVYLINGLAFPTKYLARNFQKKSQIRLTFSVKTGRNNWLKFRTNISYRSCGVSPTFIYLTN